VYIPTVAGGQVVLIETRNALVAQTSVQLHMVALHGEEQWIPTTLVSGNTTSATWSASISPLRDFSVLQAVAGLPGQVPTSFSREVSIRRKQCAADLDDGSGTGTPDSAVDINDMLYFLIAFEAGDIGVDLDNGTGTGTGDGAVTIDDLLFFLTHFEAGC
jgi:hypothetical protein